MEKCKTVTVYRFKETDELNDLLAYIISRKGDSYRFYSNWGIFDPISNKTVGREYNGGGSILHYEISVGDLEEVVEEFINLKK
jgi:hypothetical protein